MNSKLRGVLGAAVALGALQLGPAPSASAMEVRVPQSVQQVTRVVATSPAIQRPVVMHKQDREAQGPSMRTGRKPLWRQVAAFAGCIFGVGVPIGLVWVIATSPAVWAWIISRGPWPASVGASAARYLEGVRRACSYALFR